MLSDMNNYTKKSIGEWTARVVIGVGILLIIAGVAYLLFALSNLMLAIRDGANLWDALGAGRPHTADSRTASTLIAFFAILGGALTTLFAGLKARDLEFKRKNPDSVAETAILMLQAENAKLRQAKGRENNEDEGQFTD